MYEYNKTRGGLGAMIPIATPTNIGPYNTKPYRGHPYRGLRGMGWTGGFTIPGNEQQFSMRSCSGSEANPMLPTSDLVCGRSVEVNYLNRIGCTTVGFQGSHHCNTDEGNQGLFFCCPPGVLDRGLVQRGGQPSQRGAQPSALPSGILLGIGALLVVGIGWGLWDHMEKKGEDEETLSYGEY